MQYETILVIIVNSVKLIKHTRIPSYTIAQCVPACGSHGRCTSSRTCECEAGWTGIDCNEGENIQSSRKQWL